MKLYYGGKYRSESDLKATREHNPKAIPFNEPSSGGFAIIANFGSMLVLAGLFILSIKLAGNTFWQSSGQVKLGTVLALITLIPHEILHAICFRKEVYLYTNLSRGMLFVHGTEDMSKARFVFMSMLPNIVFGFIPFGMFLINHNLIAFGVLGALAIAVGFGDYMNVYHALTQMPSGAKTYISGFHSYWYKD